MKRVQKKERDQRDKGEEKVGGRTKGEAVLRTERD